MSKFRNWRWLAGLAGLALLVGGLSIASNMGFKYVPNVASTKAFNLSLPWNNNYLKASDFMNDIGADKVARFTEGGELVNWLGDSGVDFDIQKTEAYVIFAGGSPLQPVIVGSHDPNHTMGFTGGEWWNSAAPYHQTHTKASELMTDLNTQLSGAIDKIAMINENVELVNWLGDSGVDFDLTLGMGVAIYASSTASGYAWPHY